MHGITTASSADSCRGSVFIAIDVFRFKVLMAVISLDFDQFPTPAYGSGFLFFHFLFGFAYPFVVVLEGDGSHQVGAFPFFDGVGLGEGEELGPVFFGETGFEGGGGAAEPVHLACRGMASVNLVLFRLRAGGLVGAGVLASNTNGS